MKKEKRMLSVTECAKLKQVSRQAIDQAIRAGRIPCETIGAFRVIKRSDCEAYDPLDSANMAERGKRSKRGSGKKAEEGGG